MGRFIRKRLVRAVVPSLALLGAAGYGTVLLARQQRQGLGNVENQVEARTPWGDQSWQVQLLSLFPSRLFSRAFGAVCSIELPEILRERVYKSFVDVYHVELQDACEQELRKYKSLNEFFTRAIRTELRPIADTAIVSPVDGFVLDFGVLDEERKTRIKGLDYSLKEFVGHTLPELRELMQVKKEQDTCTYYAIVYLAPGNYHRFHSPADFVVKERIHFPGELLSVAPLLVERVESLFTINERILLNGTWKHGLFLMGAVGAYNVGSIALSFDKDLKTNQFIKEKGPIIKSIDSMPAKKGSELGTFKLGSTIVLVFDAPKQKINNTARSRPSININPILENKLLKTVTAVTSIAARLYNPPLSQFTIRPGQSLRYGEPIFKISK